MVSVKNLRDYVESVDNPQKDAILHLVERIEEESNRRSRILKLVQEALSTLRLDIKYLTFDLECTRKERDYLKEQINKQ